MADSVGQPLVTGSVVFDDWLPAANSLVRVELLDVTYVDASSTVVAAEEYRLDPATAAAEAADAGPAIPFTIWGREVDDRGEYIVAVTVVEAETADVVGRTLAAHPVITHGYPDVDVHVHVGYTK